MIKRTLYFGNPAYLSMSLRQLVYTCPDDCCQPGVPSKRTIPIEDIGMVVLDNPRITITQALLEKLVDNNCVLLTCDSLHLPVGMLLPMCGNTIMTERLNLQINSSLPLRKQLWQQTIQAKIANQASILSSVHDTEVGNMRAWVGRVRSGDPDNFEARAAAYYWRNMFPDIPDFVRGQDEAPPNNLLNYGYAVLRGIVARALVSSGLMPSLGIFHHNRYDAYCLADDIMEPYRPVVDKLVLDIISTLSDVKLTTDIKRKLLSVPTIEVLIDGHRSPLMVAVTTTTASLVKCFSGESRKLIYPEL